MIGLLRVYEGDYAGSHSVGGLFKEKRFVCQASKDNGPVC